MEATYRPGSPEDFDRLYRDSYARIVRTLAVVLRDTAAAEDCAQETFLRACRAWPRWRPDAPAEAWLHRIALNVASSHKRREALRSLGSLVRLVGPPAPPPAADSRAESSELLAALRRMPTSQAAVIVLRHHHGYSNREIAAALGAPESTIASRLSAAKQRLRAELGGSAGASEPEMERRSLKPAPEEFSQA